MKKTFVRLSDEDFVGNALIGLNLYKKRRCITLSEVEEFKLLAKKKMQEQGIYFGYDRGEFLIQNFCDYILLDDDVAVYRIKPEYDIQDLINSFSALLPVSVTVIFRDKELFKELNDLTVQDEENLDFFKTIDEKYQLDAVLELARLEAKKRTCQKRIEKMNNNLTSRVDDEVIDEILSLSPDVSTNELCRKLFRD